jgi:hypothetical protein
VEVTSPIEVAFQGESYVVYAVRSSVKIHKQSEEVEWICYHRYSDFEAFDSKLRLLIAEYLDTSVINLPVLPPKPWIPAAQTSRDFVESRARKLSRYLNSLILIEELQQRVQYLHLLLSFVAEGEHWEKSAEASASSSLLSKGIVNVNHGLSKLLDNRDKATPEQDFDYVQTLFKKQGLVMQKFSWDKLVIGIFGTTSAGKSSFVNHLLTLCCAASSMAGQVDTGFSFFETISEEEFRKLSPESKFPEFSVEELKEPLKAADQNLCGDKRYNYVFMYLNAEETLDRYRDQLAEDQVFFY